MLTIKDDSFKIDFECPWWYFTRHGGEFPRQYIYDLTRIIFSVDSVVWNFFVTKSPLPACKTATI